MPRNSENVEPPRVQYWPVGEGLSINNRLTTAEDVKNGLWLTESAAAMHVASGKLNSSDPATELEAANKLRAKQLETERKAQEAADAEAKAAERRAAEAQAEADRVAKAEADRLKAAQDAAAALDKGQTPAAAPKTASKA